MQRKAKKGEYFLYHTTKESLEDKTVRCTVLSYLSFIELTFKPMTNQTMLHPFKGNKQGSRVIPDACDYNSRFKSSVSVMQLSAGVILT